jgi:hypothetical protein
MRVSVGGVPLARAQARLIEVRCPSEKCAASVVASLDSPMAKCKACGLEWPWSKSAMIRATRRG